MRLSLSEIKILEAAVSFLRCTLVLSMLVNLFCFSGDARANEKKKEWSGEGYRIEMTDTSACNDGCTVNAKDLEQKEKSH